MTYDIKCNPNSKVDLNLNNGKEKKNYNSVCYSNELDKESDFFFTRNPCTKHCSCMDNLFWHKK